MTGNARKTPGNRRKFILTNSNNRKISLHYNLLPLCPWSLSFIMLFLSDVISA
jgi:hypothetical protein